MKDIEKYNFGVYYIIKQIQSADNMNTSVIPETVLSVSNCICDIYPDLSALWNTSSHDYY